MYILALVLLLVVVYFLVFKKKTATTTQKGTSKTTRRAPHNPSAFSFDNPIPKGFQIFASNLPVAGIQHRKAEAIQFARSGNQELSIEREPDNPHDPNAIRLVGVSGADRYFIGYLPREISEQIVATGLFESLKPRLTRIYIGTDDFLDFHYQILGPRTEKKRFDEFLKNKPAAVSQKEYLKFFGLPIPKGMTAGQADQAINEHTKTSTPEEQAEWLGYSTILEEFDDSEFRKDHELKKVPRGVLLEVVQQMRQGGKTYHYLSENLDEVVDRIIEVNPGLERTP